MDILIKLLIFTLKDTAPSINIFNLTKLIITGYLLKLTKIMTIKINTSHLKLITKN